MQHLLGVDSRCLTAAEDEHADLRPILAAIRPADCDQNLVPIAQRLEFLQMRVTWDHCQLFGQPWLIAGQRHLRKEDRRTATRGGSFNEVHVPFDIAVDVARS